MSRVWKERKGEKKELVKTNTTFDPKVLNAVREELQRINGVDLHVVLKNPERFGNTTARISRIKDLKDFKKEATLGSEQAQTSEPEPTKKNRPNIAKVVLETDLETGNVMVKELIGFKSLREITEKYGDGVVGRYTKDLHYMVKNSSNSIYIRNSDIYVSTGACFTAKRWKEILTEILACGEALSADIKAEAALKIQCAGRGVRERKTSIIEI